MTASATGRDRGGDKVAIVGMGALFPGANNLDEYWKNLSEGVDSVTDVPAHRWDGEFYDPAARTQKRADKFYCRRGGFVEADIDPARFGIMPNSVGDIDPDQLIALKVAAEAIDDAGGSAVLPADRARIGVVLGRGGYLTPGLARLDQQVRTATQLVRTLTEVVPGIDPGVLEQVKDAFQAQLRPPNADGAIGLVPNLSASRIANRLDLRGPAYTVDAACASSLVAVDQAVSALLSGRCDLMLAGGVHHCHDVTLWSVFSQLGALSASQQIRPFDRRADGVLIGEGTGIVVLKRLADAERAGDRVYAVIAGTGVASDGRTASLFNPDPSGQVQAVSQAWSAAGLDPRAPGSIGLLEAHGTGTVAGDGAELKTLLEVFGPHRPDEARPVIGTVKSMIGHTMPAAGAAGLIKAALAVHHRTLLPTLHCAEPHPTLSETRFAPIESAQPWELAGGQSARRAGVNAFGFGGINAHVILEESLIRAAPITVTEPAALVRLAAGTVSDLAELLAQPDSLLRQHDIGDGRVRIAIADPTPKRLALARKAVARGVPWRGRSNMWFTPTPLLEPGGGKIAMVFPGLEAEFAPDIGSLATELGISSVSDLAVGAGHVGSHGAAVFQLGRILHRALTRLGVRADGFAGHSVGEWSAMTEGGIFSHTEIDAFLDQFDPSSVTVPGVEFAVIGASAPHVAQAITEWPEVVLSHDNAPNQSIVCGPADAIATVVERFRADGVISQVLPFQSGFHTPMLAPFLGPIVRDFESLSVHPAKTPVWSATTMAPFPADPATIRRIYIRHLVETVRFRELITNMHGAGFAAFIQMGTGQVSALIGDILQGRDHLAIPAHAPKAGAAEQLDRVRAALWVEGYQSGGAPVRAGQQVRIDLSGSLISIPQDQRVVVKTAAAQEMPTTAWGTEFAALVEDTQRAARELMAAAAAPRSSTPIIAPITSLETSLDVSLRAMPYLIDHSFFKLPPDWPDHEERWPVVPATTLVDHMTGFARQAAPGRVAMTLTDVRFDKWLPVIPSVTVPVTAVPSADGTVAVTIQGHARARVTVAPAYPVRRPASWRFEREHVPKDKASELYSRRWMFHGPQFQGVTELTAIGARHVRGVLTTPAAPGALLDNAGQLLGYWVQSTVTERSTVFPVGMGRIEFFGDHPTPGTAVDCTVVIRELNDQFITADVQLAVHGQVWAQITGWQDRRFDSNPVIRATDCAPEEHALSTLRPEGWAEVTEMWPDLATRELVARKMLGRSEREQYAAIPPRRRRQWLLGRIAAKDAVRQYLWQTQPGGIYPQELEIGNAASGVPFVRGRHRRVLPHLTVSLAHCAEIGVAIARDGACGIDAEEIRVRDAAAELAALTAAEKTLLDDLSGERALWFTRLWTAKEAVAKRLGTGLQGEPKRFEIVAVHPGAGSGARLSVAAAGDVFEVSTVVTENPPSLPSRRYVVAWTGHTDEETEN
ncbi:polyketide synthase dehydratase domain-containing protein [Hoyosella sp. YIM 151337]|uniref:beta-ketoacyl synthase N-terminal-like domain-containing protein n=1 Tax=Hoyosella sp. YIM 151337 TaxID=2992742 RepID=UPI002235E78F|nr:beta-ketoacyl synthase N-terminal-like domain-containing protein [Hoyosella sp. YIM 151337]MCW4354241.1 polyketide synthase dehydratase domain-containing protein [Hoyosella sp. YIM 151337]